MLSLRPLEKIIAKLKKEKKDSIDKINLGLNSNISQDVGVFELIQKTAEVLSKRESSPSSVEEVIFEGEINEADLLNEKYISSIDSHGVQHFDLVNLFYKIPNTEKLDELSIGQKVVLEFEQKTLDSYYNLSETSGVVKRELTYVVSMKYSYGVTSLISKVDFDAITQAELGMTIPIEYLDGKISYMTFSVVELIPSINYDFEYRLGLFPNESNLGVSFCSGHYKAPQVRFNESYTLCGNPVYYDTSGFKKITDYLENWGKDNNDNLTDTQKNSLKNIISLLENYITSGETNSLVFENVFRKGYTGSKISNDNGPIHQVDPEHNSWGNDYIDSLEEIVRIFRLRYNLDKEENFNLSRKHLNLTNLRKINTGFKNWISTGGLGDSTGLICITGHHGDVYSSQPLTLTKVKIIR